MWFADVDLVCLSGADVAFVVGFVLIIGLRFSFAVWGWAGVC